MTITIPSEIYWLILTAVMTSLLWMPYAVVRIAKIGWARVFMNPLPGDDPFEQAWAHRAYRAHMNAIENLVVFAPLALAVVATHSSNAVTEAACATYFWARVVHVPIYILKVPIFRLVSFMVGLGACLTLAYQLLA